MKFRFKAGYLLFVVVPFVLWLYNPFQLYFLNDDAVHVPQSANLQISLHSSFRVLAELSLFIDHKLYGKSAWGYHFTNLVLHLAATFLLYFVARRWTICFPSTNKKAFPFLSAFLFFIYAFHSEGVLWIIGRGGSLATAFAALSLLFYTDRNKSRWHYSLSLFFFTGGLFTYESVWVLPLFISLFTVLSVPKEKLRTEYIYVLGYWAIFGLYLFLRKAVYASFFGSPYGISDDPASFVLKKYAYNYSVLFFRSFLPPSATSVFVLLAGMLVAAAIALFFSFFRQKLFTRFRVFLYLSFLASFLPYIMFGIDTHDSEGERFLYLPSFLCCMIIADLLLLIASKKLQQAAIVLFVLFHLSFLYQASEAFKKSSIIAGKTMALLLQSNESFDTVYLVDVPTQYKGVPIFRIGFEPILRWMAPELQFKKVVEVSSREVMTGEKTFRATVQPWDSEPVRKLQAFAKDNNLLPHRRNALFVWTDSTFLFVR